MTGASTPSPFVASASTAWSGNEAWEAFKSIITVNDVWAGSNGGTDWLKLDIGTGNSKICAKYIITFRDFDPPYPNQAPKDWTLEGSNNDSDWDTLDTVSGEIDWTAGEVREFFCDTQTTAYRYFRLSITNNNGDTTFIVIGYLQLFEIE